MQLLEPCPVFLHHGLLYLTRPMFFKIIMSIMITIMVIMLSMNRMIIIVIVIYNDMIVHNINIIICHYNYIWDNHDDLKPNRKLSLWIHSWVGRDKVLHPQVASCIVAIIIIIMVVMIMIIMISIDHHHHHGDPQDGSEQLVRCLWKVNCIIIYTVYHYLNIWKSIWSF